MRLLSLLATLGLAHAQSVTVINPTASGEGAVSVAAGLAAAADAALARNPRLSRAGEQALRADEVAAVFGCLEFDRACARQAGQAAGAQLVLTGDVGRVDQRFSVELALLRVADGRVERAGYRLIRQQGDPARLQGGVELALQQLAEQVLNEAEPMRAAIILPGVVSARTDEGVPVPARRVTGVSPGAHRLLFDNDAELAVQVRPDEALVLAAPVPQPDPGLSPVAITAWITAGGAAVALISAGYLGSQVAQEQSDYDNGQDPERLKHNVETGTGAADAANALLIAGGVAATISIVLFVID